MNRVAFHTLGCKVNAYDTEAIWHLFQKAGYVQVPFDEEADVYVINTCSVTNVGDRKSRQVIRRAIRRNPEAAIVVTGCYAQVAPGEVAAIPGVDLVMGNDGRGRIVEWVEKVREERRPFHVVPDLRRVREFEELDVPAFTDRARANLKIQDGCNNFCSFCIIPFSRGFIRSRKPENVIRQARRLVEAGYREIVLTGIHTGGYGTDLDGYSLADLLVDLQTQVEGLGRIRISSIEASQIDERMLEVLHRSGKVCRHLHIPLQSGHDEVLRRMRRRYTVAEYAETVRRIREVLPEVSLTTDVIVGFPGETEQQFEATRRLIEELRFSQLHIFPYSPRRGTAAARYPDQVPAEVKERRVRQLVRLSKDLTRAYASRFVGKTLAVVVESAFDGRTAEEGAPLFVGHADNYLEVVFPGDPSMIGQLVEVRLEDPGAERSYGSLVRQLTFAPEEEGNRAEMGDSPGVFQMAPESEERAVAAGKTD
ncbi:MAG: tRNA (N(6)-L-threonylcarbamoyladenosine(37)-C(2))-methylthiotransferase MtaB [Kyrpidia sp.]|nr:tRNA (N(6)-L-threonylcarbamoyladenosine(37)-C(2))-methylthiotransferase MtaB [Kyrpidia sp.]